MWSAFLIFGVGCGLIVFHVTRLVVARKRTRDDGTERHLKRGGLLNLCGKFGASLGRTLPQLFARKLARDELVLHLAGLTPTWRGSDILGMQALGLGITLALGVLLVSKLGGLALAYPVFGVFLPRWAIVMKKDARQKEMARDFPLALDMMAVALGATGSIQAAVKGISAYLRQGVVRTELRRIIDDTKTGAFDDALRRCSDRVESLEIKAALAALVQAETQGTDALSTLHAQAEQLRYSRTMRAEEAAQKAPVKMIFPLVVFILPCVFLVVLGPIVISMVTSLKEASLF